MSVTETPTGKLSTLEQALHEQEAGLLNCVHCGFCLPACPTYRRLGDEADSPRGRLHLMGAVVEGRLAPDSEAFQTHIDRCLGCRACEPVCPSGVEYGKMLELARSVARDAGGGGRLGRLFLGLFARPTTSRLFLAAGRFMRATGIPALARRIPATGITRQARMGLAMLAASAPGRIPSRAPGQTAGTSGEGGSRVEVAERPAPGSRGRVGFLVGCVQAGLFGRINDATRRVLTVNGFDVVEVQGQGCCGALHAHGGDLESARRLAERNIAAFAAAGVDHVVMNASGCGAAMAEYHQWMEADENPRAAEVAGRVVDVSQLLADHEPVVGSPVPMTVTYDAPCHLVHAQRVDDAPYVVLESIPDMTLRRMPTANECCGGAGIYGITHPDLGGRIGGDKVDAVLATGAEAVVTGNPGCMMQIGAELRLRGEPVSVLHPVELLDESYRRAGYYDERRPP